MYRSTRSQVAKRSALKDLPSDNYLVPQVKPLAGHVKKAKVKVKQTSSFRETFPGRLNWKIRHFDKPVTSTPTATVKSVKSVFSKKDCFGFDDSESDGEKDYSNVISPIPKENNENTAVGKAGQGKDKNQINIPAPAAPDLIFSPIASVVRKANKAETQKANDQVTPPTPPAYIMRSSTSSVSLAAPTKANKAKQGPRKRNITEQVVDTADKLAPAAPDLMFSPNASLGRKSNYTETQKVNDKVTVPTPPTRSMRSSKSSPALAAPTKAIKAKPGPRKRKIITEQVVDTVDKLTPAASDLMFSPIASPVRKANETETQKVNDKVTAPTPPTRSTRSSKSSVALVAPTKAIKAKPGPRKRKIITEQVTTTIPVPEPASDCILMDEVNEQYLCIQPSDIGNPDAKVNDFNGLLARYNFDEDKEDEFRINPSKALITYPVKRKSSSEPQNKKSKTKFLQTTKKVTKVKKNKEKKSKPVGSKRFGKKNEYEEVDEATKEWLEKKNKEFQEILKVNLIVERSRNNPPE